MKYSLDEWWSSLCITEKERIAKKLFKEDTEYPHCTSQWLLLPEEMKQKVHDHVTEQHGQVMKDWSEGDTFAY